MDKEQLKQRVSKAIDENRSRIIDIGEQILKNPELGFKEQKTSILVKDVFKNLGLPFEENLAITGVKALGKGKSHDVKVAIMGELDAVVSPQHPYADSITGAAHACGHNAQVANMLGAAIGMTAANAFGELSGDVAFMAVPAEEYVELEYREKLRDEGKIKFFSGKQEFIRIGAFDDIDMGMMVHSNAGVGERKAFISGGSTGFIGKTVRYKGKILLMIKHYVDDIVTVDEDEIANAILLLMERAKVISEGAGAVPIAAILNRLENIKNKKIVALVSGGNIDVNMLSRIIDKGLVNYP